MPYDVWRGVDAATLERLLAASPLPSPSPALATLIARALATGDPASGPDLAPRIAALQRAGRVAEEVELLDRAVAANDPGALGRYALALLASGREDDACEVRLGGAPGEGGAARPGLLCRGAGATCRERSLRFSSRVTVARRWGWPPPRSPA